MDNPDPRGQYKCLMKHFFRRFFDFEAISSPQIDSIEKNALTFQVLALMVMPGLLTSLLLLGNMRTTSIVQPSSGTWQPLRTSASFCL